jgi:hypothetical protein
VAVRVSWHVQGRAGMADRLARIYGTGNAICALRGVVLPAVLQPLLRWQTLAGMCLRGCSAASLARCLCRAHVCAV